VSDRPTLNALISLAGRRALVTGAAAGIGRAIAERLAEAGAALELVDLDGDALDRAATELARHGTDIRTHRCDVADRSAIAQLWRELDDHPPDTLVNNAGIYPGRPFLKLDEALYRNVMAVNLDAVVWMCQAMIERNRDRGGTIVNLASIEAILPFKDDLAHYSVSKAGVIALSRALAREHGRHGFRVNCLLPGGIVTPGTRRVAQEILQGKLGLVKTGLDFRQRLPIGRLGQPDEIARMVLVLASELASYMQGAVVAVDGGFLTA
jgi:NAD(P)-dependent dehydrogenase (short-subunit alcohol dehydrogenase family)